jgi:hypothetical protein
MNCHAVVNVLDLYEEGRLSPRRAKAATKHMASCPECGALARSAAPAAARSSARAPESLKAKLLSAAKAGPAAAPPSGAVSELHLWPREARGIALAAAALLVVGLLIAAVGAPSQSAGGAVAAVEEP